MVLLKDILNQDNHGDPDSSQSNASDGGRRSSNCLPSPTLSASSQLSNSGNVDGDNYYLADTRSSSCDSAAGGHAGTPQSELSSGSEEEHLVCRWDTCGKVFNQAELLYHHLCKDHVGRKSQKNLQLDCKWGDCQAKTEKRDHITSHLRVHIALKPFKCTTCGKNFKRPQDLKKHLKTHIESHIIFKKKRGPKVGSKRVSKKDLDRKDSTGNDSAGSPLNRSSSPSGQSLISLQQLVTNELPSYEPIYSQRLGARLNTVLPPISADDNLPRSAPLATTSAAHFFSALSSNMLNSRPVQQPVYQHVQKPVINIEPPAAGTPPLAGTLGHATYPKIRPLPPIEPQFISDRNSTLPSLSSVPFFVPRHQTFERVSHFNNPAEYYSTVQRSSGRSDASEQQDLTEALTSLDIASYDEEYEETLETVNLIRDYLVCLLLEDEYADESKSTGSHPARERISRYPQVVM